MTDRPPPRSDLAVVLDRPQPARDIARLLDIMAALRTPVTGCPWDIAQTSASILPYTLEEAQEVADAVLRGDPLDLAEELGDLLLQVVFHARMAQENGAFDFGDVVYAITSKLIRRHPHVFGERRDLAAHEVKGLWNEIKAEEKRLRADTRRAAGLFAEKTGLLDDVLPTAPALTRALKLQQKAAAVGFDWNDASQVLAKIKEEIAEIEEAMHQQVPEAIREEIGDLLFAVANLARHAEGEPEIILQQANDKFQRRFGGMETLAADKALSFVSLSLEEMEALWGEVKQGERLKAV